MSDFDKLVDVDSVLEQEQRESRALLLLLDKQRDRRDHLFALDARMGTTKSFVTSASLEWVAQRVRFSTELPLFREHKDPETGKIKLDRETAAIIQQREPDWSRQWDMTLYLAKRRRHKFPPILVVANQPWVDEPSSDNWSRDHRATRDSINARTLDSHGYYYDLHIADEDLLYAIDGQHRLMAIKGLAELLNTGRLSFRDRDGREKQRTITVDEILEQSRHDVSRSDLQALLAERIGMEVLPAVAKGETRSEALRRVRSVFVHVNRTAVSLTKGEIALLDEDDGFAVVARLAMVNHPLLKDHVQQKRGQLAASSLDFTTLETLVNQSRLYLGQFEEFSSWKPDTKTELPVRPEEEEIDHGYEKLIEYFDALQEFPSHTRLVQGKPANKIRNEEDHILFRPIAQMALAEAIGKLIVDHSMSLEAIVRCLSGKEEESQLTLTEVASPWYGVLWDPSKAGMRRAASNQRLCSRLLVHLIGGGTSDDKAREDLRSQFAEARIIDPEDNKAIDLKGRRVTPDQIDLPSPW